MRKQKAQAKQYIIIKWSNTISGDTGYIERLDYKNRHFINTYDESNAFWFEAEVLNDLLELLHEYNESKNNLFEAIEVKRKRS